MTELKVEFREKWFLFLCVVAILLMLFVPTLSITTCTMGSEDVWLVNIIFTAPAMLLVSVLVRYAYIPIWGGWVSLCVFPAALLALYTVCEYFLGVTIQGGHFCTVLKGHDFNAYQSSWWSQFWAPVMMLSILVLSFAFVGVLKR